MAETEQEAATLRQLAEALGDQLAGVLPGWAEAATRARAPRSAEPIDVDRAAESVKRHASDVVVPEIRRLLATDIDQQWSSPLEVARSVVGPVTAELDELGAEEVQRDPRSVELLPADRYALTPATFADLHPDLHEPGLAWGAAKAHIHLKRHAQQPAPVVVVFAPELGDRSRFDAFTVAHVRSAGKLAEFAETTEPDLVIVDLDRTSEPADFRIDNAHVIGFGSHVDTDRHDAALDAGFDAVMARSIFFRRLPELLEPVRKAPA